MHAKDLENGLFPELLEPKIKPKLKTFFLSDLGFLTSAQAMGAGYVCIKPPKRGSFRSWKGVWIAAADMSAAMSLMDEIAQIRTSRKGLPNITERRHILSEMLACHFGDCPPSDIVRWAEQFSRSSSFRTCHADRLDEAWTRFCHSKKLKASPWLSMLVFAKGVPLLSLQSDSASPEGLVCSFEISWGAASDLVFSEKNESMSLAKIMSEKALLGAENSLRSVDLPKFVASRGCLVKLVLESGKVPQREDAFRHWLTCEVDKDWQKLGFTVSGVEMVRKFSSRSKVLGRESTVRKRMDIEDLSRELLTVDAEDLISALGVLEERWCRSVAERVGIIENETSLTSFLRRLRIPGLSVSGEFLDGLRVKVREAFVDSPDFLSDDRAFSKVISSAAENVTKGMGLASVLRACGMELPKTLPDFYPSAREMKRKIKLVIGETNSGKTWLALEKLKASRTGCYLGPLRLLALEVRDTLRDAGFPCSLVTGESVEMVDDAKYVSSTVEMADMSSRVDVAILDEFQMFEDKERGSAWVEAFVGVPAKELYVLGSPDCEDAVMELASRLGEDVEVERCVRKTPLSVMKFPKRMGDVSSGDAVIAFSRKTVLDLSAALKSKGKTVSTIYGSLSPEVRREEARRFRSGESQVLVATDAIGMGLNLPIKSILFFESKKWDGFSEGGVPSRLVRQIAGRAGRFGFHESGEVGALSSDVLGYVCRALESPSARQSPVFRFSPSWRMVSTLSKHLESNDLSQIMSFFMENFGSLGEGFLPSISQDRLGLAELADGFSGMSLYDKFVVSSAPVVKWKYEFDGCVREFVSVIASKRSLHPGESRFIEADDSDLDGLENDVKRLTLYCWLHYRFPERFPHVKSARSMIESAERSIIKLLRKGRSRSCVSCGDPLPQGHRFAKCESCWRPWN